MKTLKDVIAFLQELQGRGFISLEGKGPDDAETMSEIDEGVLEEAIQLLDAINANLTEAKISLGKIES